MIVELPEWQPFSPGVIPWTPEPADRGRVVLALAPAPANREQWSAELLFDLLDGWGEAGHRVVLADFVLEHPMLHRTAGLTNEEGLVDAALYGASISRVARAVPGRSFFFVGAGSPVGDVDVVLASPRLERLQEGFREAGVTFVAFVREGCVGESMLIQDAEDVLVLAPTAEDLSARLGDAADKVRAVVGPAIDEAAAAGSDFDAELPPVPVGGDEMPKSGGAGSAEGFQGIELVDAAVAAESPADPGSPQSIDSSESGQTEDPDTPGSDGEDLAIADLRQAEEREMDFSAQDDPGSDEAVTSGVDDAPPAPAIEPEPRERIRPAARRGADPDARKKLLWVALAVLVLAVLVVLGALG